MQIFMFNFSRSPRHPFKVFIFNVLLVSLPGGNFSGKMAKDEKGIGAYYIKF